MFTLQTITAAICTYWRDALPEPVATAYPGVQLATEGLAEWYELDLEEWTGVSRRDAVPQEVLTVLRLRCFVRPGVATGRVLQLAEYSRTAFSEQDVPIYEADMSEPAILGWIRFNPGVLRDFSRGDRDQRRPPLRHVEWTWTGSVWACYPVSLTSSDSSDPETEFTSEDSTDWVGSD
jgi:hypothetical protein